MKIKIKLVLKEKVKIMTIMPMFKICPKCKRRYSWNPDARNMWCPYCGPLSIVNNLRKKKNVNDEKARRL
mgnify:CR=1 FL=1